MGDDSSQAMPRAGDSQNASAALRPEVQRIIQSGRVRDVRAAGSLFSIVLLGLLSGGLLWVSFTPLEFSFAAWFALVPLASMARLVSLPRFSWLALWGAGFLTYLVTLQWMRLGHPAMFLALVALAAYVGLYFPAFVFLLRRSSRWGLPIWLAVPVLWTGLEYARAWLLTGFSWYYLGHSQYRWTTLIQISDLVGSYGVTFLVALYSGVITELLPLRWLQKLKLDTPESSGEPRSIRPLLIATAMLCLTLGYGYIRKMPTESFLAGPSIALIQGNFTPELKHDRDLILTRFRVHNTMMQSSIELQPDFIVWPETMFPWPVQSAAEGVTDEQILNQIPREVLKDYGDEAHLLTEPFRTKEVQKSLASHAQGVGAALVIGVEALVAEKDKTQIFNAAAFVRPDLGYSGRYDKIHRVIFGEYIPLRDIFPWLHQLTPFGAGFGIDAGSEVRTFEYGDYSIVPMICFEDTVPQLVRRMAAQKDSTGQSCDVLVNLTNDAWFRGSSELDQHLITSAFRCVETRMPLVRAVNGGISAFVDGNGEIRDPAKILVLKEPLEGLSPELKEVKGLRDESTGKWRRQFSGIVFGQVPLDPRESLYVRWGDWFAGLCLIATLFCIMPRRMK
ncbi:MAG: apolipoprotein N-acyltransferase [Planctomycetaceae bacterium]